MRSIRRLVLIAAFSAATVFLACSSDPALADKRVALVVGNSAYQHVAKLPNPASDASAVARMFKNAGFDIVDLQLDLGNLDFKRAIRRFEDAASDADMAVVFFAGHGLELRGTNYMIPVDARLADDRDAPDEAITLDRIVEAVDGAKRLRLVIVDACRDNPFAVNMKRLASLRTVTRGLARVEPQGTDTLIAYAARAGSTAEDGHGDHSPLTTALLDNLTAPGLDIRLAFGRVRDQVMKITGNKQEPFVYGSLGGGVVSLVPPPSQPKEPLAADVKGDYELVKEVGTKKAWEVFLNTYKTGFYSDLAAAQLGKLLATEQGPKVATLEMPTPPSPSPAPPSSDEQRAWDRIRDTGDQAALQEFIKRYPRSPLALNAQKRLETLQQIAREREEKAPTDREAAQQRAEDERRAKAAEAERQKAEQQAALQAKAAEAERLKAEQQAALEAALRAKAAEAERLKAEQQAALQAKAAEAERLKAEQQAKAAEAERQKAEQQAKAVEAERQKAAQTAPTGQNDDHVTPGPNPNNVAAPAPAKASAAEARAWDQIKDSDKQAALQDFIKRYPKSPLVLNAQKRLETLQQIAQEREEKARADREAAQQRAEDERRAKAAEVERQKAEKVAEAERQKAEQQAALQAKAAEAERLKAEKAAGAERQKAEQQAALQAKAAEAERLKAEKAAEAERQKAEKAAEAERQKAEQQAVLEAKAAEAERQKAEKPAVPVVAANTSELIQAAQVELSRLGCFSGKPDGTLNAATKTGINRYLSRRGSPDPEAVVTASFVSELRNQQLKNCQLDCPSGQKADGDTCVASKASPQNSKTARQHDDVQDKPKASRPPAKQETRQAADKKPERPERPSAAPQPQVHQEVSSTPRGSSMIGVGF